MKIPKFKVGWKTYADQMYQSSCTFELLDHALIHYNKCLGAENLEVSLHSISDDYHVLMKHYDAFAYIGASLVGLELL